MVYEQTEEARHNAAVIIPTTTANTVEKRTLKGDREAGTQVVARRTHTATTTEHLSSLVAIPYSAKHIRDPTESRSHIR